MLPERRLVREGLYLINTRLGWMLTGRVESNGSNGPGLADLTFALTNGALVKSRELCLSARDSFLLKRSIEKPEVKRAPVLTINSPMNRPSRTTCCAILCETSLAEEFIETIQSPAIVGISPAETSPVPMLETTTSRTEVKFLNGIQRRSAQTNFTPLDFDHLLPDMKTRRTSAWTKRIPMRIVSWSQQTFFEGTSSSVQSRSYRDDRAKLARSQRRAVTERCERAVIFDPGRPAWTSSTRAATPSRERECAHQTLLAGVSRSASS